MPKVAPEEHALSPARSCANLDGIHELFKHMTAPSPRIRYRFAEFTVSPSTRLLLKGDVEIPLIPRYFDLLVLLIERRNEAVTRDEIFDKVWHDVIVSDGALTQAIRILRRSLRERAKEPQFIRTVSRHGYRFVYEDVVEEVITDNGDTLQGSPRASRGRRTPVERGRGDATAGGRGNGSALESRRRPVSVQRCRARSSARCSLGSSRR